VTTTTSSPPTEAELDQLTRDLTAFNTFREMLDTSSSYRPTILPRDVRYVLLADAYDVAMIGRGDPRRAYRGSRDNRPVPVTLNVSEARALVAFFDEYVEIIQEGGWDDVDSAHTKLAIALEHVG